MEFSFALLPVTLCLSAAFAVSAGPLRADVVVPNWSGYSATNSAPRTFTSVMASWTQPLLSCTYRTSYAVFWAGLDGNGSDTVEQTGTLGECSRGIAAYSAWYEMCPGAMVSLKGIVEPGDDMTSIVTANDKGGFTLVLSDTTQKWTDTETARLSSAEQQSAEAVAEAPSRGDRILPLADFGTVDFYRVRVNGSPIATASNLDRFDIVSKGGQLEAGTSTLSGGSGFSVTDSNWHEPGSYSAG